MKIEKKYDVKRPWLISYPRSGNSFIRFAVEKITKMRTTEGNNYDMISGDNISGPVILSKRHRGTRYDKVDKIILLLRNYRDVYISHNFRNIDLTKYDINKLYNEIIKDKRVIGDFFSFQDYYNLINFYDKFEGDKIIIKYEDLITNKTENIKSVIDFILPDNDIKINQNMINKISDDSKKKYKNVAGIKTSKIKILHSVLSDEQNINIDKKVRNMNTKLFDKYLYPYLYKK